MALNKMVLEELLDLLEKKKFKRILIKELNENIDIPMFNEKIEKKALDAFYDLLVKTLKNMAD